MPNRDLRTHWIRLPLAAVVLLSGAFSVTRAQNEEPPAAGRPENYGGLVGTFEIDSRARPTSIRVLEPLTLTVKIMETSGKTPSFALERADLRILPASLARDFYVEPLADLPRPDSHTWEFAYRLKPKNAAVQKIPALKLTYYDSRYGKYQVAYSRSIPLKILPSEVAPSPPREKGHSAPDFVYQIVTGPGVLKRAEPPRIVSPFILALLLLAPPAVCATWYILWRRLRPDEARWARLQKSRAARHALRQLHTLRSAGGAEAATVVAQYLRQRLSLAVAEPTPADVWIHLRRARVAAPLASKVHQFFRACDASRFAPADQRDGQALATEAERIIHAVEAEACLSRFSC